MPIKPSQERLQALFDYEAGSGLLRWKVSKSNAVRAGTVAGNLSDSGQVRVKIDGHQYMASHIILALTNGYWPSSVRHVNKISSDNRLENLNARI